MTLNELICGVLSQLHRPADSQSYDLWRERLRLFLNEGQRDLACALHPTSCESLSIINHRIDLTRTRCSFIKAQAVYVNERREGFYYSVNGAELIVPNVKEAECLLRYRYLPRDLVKDEDEPQLPTAWQPLLISYAQAREQGMGDAASVNCARLGLGLYESQKARLKSDSGGDFVPTLVNRY